MKDPGKYPVKKRFHPRGAGALRVARVADVLLI